VSAQEERQERQYQPYGDNPRAAKTVSDTFLWAALQPSQYWRFLALQYFKKVTAITDAIGSHLINLEMWRPSPRRRYISALQSLGLTD
jgi:hypothetical protein